MIFFIAFGLIGFGFLYCYLCTIQEKAKEKVDHKVKRIEEVLSGIKGFPQGQRIIGADMMSAIAIDENQEKFCLLNFIAQGTSYDVLSYKDLLSTELVVDGNSITKTSTSSSLGRALLGGLVLGGLGAIIGGLSGKTKTADEVNRVDLVLIVNDRKNPIHTICFQNFKTNEDSLFHKQTMAKARHWHGLLESFIKRADRENITSNLNSTAELDPRFIASEIRKLAELLESGALTQEEFHQQKTKLLAMDTPKV